MSGTFLGCVCVYMSYLQYQVLPMTLNPEYAVCSRLQRRPPRGRVLWLCEPSSAYCLSYKENTTHKDRCTGLRWLVRTGVRANTRNYMATVQFKM